MRGIRWMPPFVVLLLVLQALLLKSGGLKPWTTTVVWVAVAVNCIHLAWIFWPALRRLRCIIRGGCRHKWEICTENDKPIEYAAAVEGDPRSTTGMAMPICWMRVCQNCARMEVSHLKNERPHAGWHEVVRMTEEHHFYVQDQTPFGSGGTFCPKGTPVVKRLR